MPKIKHITTGDIISVAQTPVFDSGIWDCGDQRFTDVSGTEYEVVDAMKPIINFTYHPAAAKATDITVDVAVVNSADNSPVPVTETYYVPLINIITGAMEKMLVIPVVDGIGQVIFSVANAGVVGINVDLIRPKPTAAFSALPDIAIY